LKLLGQLLIGSGIILFGVSLGYLSCEVTGACVGNASEISFFNTLELGAIVAGMGVMVMGFALWMDSLQRGVA
jgi:hypothetical protein